MDNFACNRGEYFETISYWSAELTNISLRRSSAMFMKQLFLVIVYELQGCVQTLQDCDTFHRKARLTCGKRLLKPARIRSTISKVISLNESETVYLCFFRSPTLKVCLQPIIRIFCCQVILTVM